MKVAVRVREVAKKTCHVNYVIAHRVTPSLYFVEIDFNGECRPAYIGHGDDVLVFAPQTRDPAEGSDDIPDGIISVEFKLPRGFQHTCIFGSVSKRTWRGFIVRSGSLADAYDQEKVVWSGTEDKPIRTKC